MAKSDKFTKEDVRLAMAACYRDMAVEIEQVTSGRIADWERWEQLQCSSDVSAEARVARNDWTFTQHVKSIAQRALASSGLMLGDLPSERQDDVLDGATRVVLEVERLRQFRLHDRLADYSVTDNLFDQGHASYGFRSAAIGPSLGEAVDAYLKMKQRSWTRKTHAIRSRYLGYLREHLGADRVLSGISTADMRDFRDSITKLRRNTGKASQRSFRERQTANPKHWISDSTASLVFVPAQAFFRWCVAEQGYLDKNPAENLRMPTAKKPKGMTSRRPFSPEELVTLFQAPVFTGCQSVKRRLVSGENVIRDAYYWIPILGFYTGARLGELVQIHLADVMAEDGIPFLSITEVGGAGPAAKHQKHVKSEAAIRRIPLHPDIVKLGFLDFVNDRRNRRRGTKRLFPEVKFGADGQASTVFSKWFGRLMGRIGLADPALVFHSFRHNAEDAFRDALQPQYVIDRIIGHSDGATSAGYGDGVGLVTAYAAVQAMQNKVCVSALLDVQSVPESF